MPLNPGTRFGPYLEAEEAIADPQAASGAIRGTLPGPTRARPAWITAACLVGLAALFAYPADLRTRRRVSAALIWGGAATLGTPFVMRVLATTPAALRLADLVL